MSKLRLCQILRLLGNERRLRIVNLLLEAERELCVCELREVLKLPQATLSQLIAPLRQMGLLNSRRQSQWVHYSVPRDLQPWLRQVIANFPGREGIFEKDRLSYTRLVSSCHAAVDGKATPTGEHKFASKAKTQSIAKRSS